MTSGINSGPSILPFSSDAPAGVEHKPPASGFVQGGYAREPVNGQATGKPLNTRYSSYPSLVGGVDVAAAARHMDHQNFHGGMSSVGNPYVSSDDHLLATDLKNNFSELSQFMSEGRLNQAALLKISKEDPNTGTVAERTIMLAREILNRPRLNEAILAKGRDITPESLSKAADLMVGNTSPNTQSADPYHAKSDAQVVQALRGMFDDLRDKSADLTWPFDKHRFVKKDKLIEMSRDPDEVGNNGEVVRDPGNGFPKKKYSEQQVYLAKNVVERPGLLASLDSYKANGFAITGSRNDDGWIKNHSLDRWLENDKKEKGI